MRTTIVSITFIGLALASIVAGYVSVAPTAPRVAHVAQPAPTGKVVALAHGYSNGNVIDLFSDDDVVVERATRGESTIRQPQLAIVVGLCGYAAVVDAQFMQLDVPLAFDIDPRGADAAKTAAFARSDRDLVFVHVARAPSARTLAGLRSQLGDFSGVASRDPDGMAAALQGTGLGFFDERGSAAPEPFLRAGVQFATRDETADDLTSETYVNFMLGQAASRSQHQGRIVVLVRPLAASLSSLQTFIGMKSAEIVPLM